MFCFLCKQGQEADVVRVLREYGKPHLKKYMGDRGRGVMVELESDRSNRFLDRALYKAGVKGAVSRKNKLPVIKVRELWELNYHPQLQGKVVRFCLAYNGKIGKAVLRRLPPHCSCCSAEVSLLWKGEDYRTA